MQILGTLSASTERSDYKDKNHWLILEDVNNLSIDGGSTGIINGNGKIWWQNSCKIDKSKVCISPPISICHTYINLSNILLYNRHHVSINWFPLSFLNAAMHTSANGTYAPHIYD